LVEGDRLRAEIPWVERLTRFNYDASLIAAFMDFIGQIDWMVDA
jgi:hypothetical protein